MCFSDLVRQLTCRLYFLKRHYLLVAIAMMTASCSSVHYAGAYSRKNSWHIHHLLSFWAKIKPIRN